MSNQNHKLRVATRSTKNESCNNKVGRMLVEFAIKVTKVESASNPHELPDLPRIDFAGPTVQGVSDSVENPVVKHPLQSKRCKQGRNEVIQAIQGVARILLFI